jgi:hypothetical protein
MNAKRLLVFLCASPVAAGASFCLVSFVDPNIWAEFSSRLFHFYDSVGLSGEMPLFSWSWTTVFVILIALPYAAAVLAADLFFAVWNGRLAGFRRSLVGGAYVVALVGPMLPVLAAIRVIDPLLPPLLGPGHSALSLILIWQIYAGLAYALISLAILDFLTGAIRKRRLSTQEKLSGSPPI